MEGGGLQQTLPSLEDCFLRDAIRRCVCVKPYSKCLGNLEYGSKARVAFCTECTVETVLVKLFRTLR